MSPPPGTSERLYRLYRLCCSIRWISAISMSQRESFNFQSEDPHFIRENRFLSIREDFYILYA